VSERRVGREGKRRGGEGVDKDDTRRRKMRRKEKRANKEMRI
jgi:hypothetical protein